MSKLIVLKKTFVLSSWKLIKLFYIFNHTLQKFKKNH
jgi:hypothetical protein